MIMMMLRQAKLMKPHRIISQSKLVAAAQVRLLGSETPPEPIPNRPLRGQRPAHHPREDFSYQRQRTQTSPRRPPPPPPTKEGSGDNRNRVVRDNGDYSLVSDEAFLDKFKLGGPTPTPTPTATAPNTLNPKTPLHADNDTAAAVAAANDDVESQEEEDAEEIFKKMKETGLIPNAVAMLDGLCKDGLVQDALKLFNLMRDKGSIPEVVVYTAVVDAFCKARRIPDAIRVFRKMQSHAISPNAFSYSILLQGLAKCSGGDHLDDALHFALEMLRSGHSPNVPTFVALVDAFCRERGVQEARSLVSTLSQNGFLLNKKAVSDYLDKNAPNATATSSSLSQAIFGNDTHSKPTTLF